MKGAAGEGEHGPFVAAVEVFIFRGERILAMRRARSSEAAPVAGQWLRGYFALEDSLPGLPSPVTVNGRSGR